MTDGPRRAHAFAARAEFRRGDPGGRWVLAGVLVEGRFWPAADGIERVRQRLPATGLLGWTDLPSPILAPDQPTAAAVALEVARVTWPSRARGPVPWSGTRERR